MKLRDLDKEQFKKFDNIEVSMNNLYFQCNDKEIYEILKHYVTNTNYFENLIEVKIINKLQDSLEDHNKAYLHCIHTLFNSLNVQEKEFLINLSLENQNFSVLSVFLSNPYIKLNNEQFEKIFNHEEYMVRRALISNPNIPLSAEQVNRGLTDYGIYDMREVYAERHDSNIYPETINGILLGVRGHDEMAIELLKNPNINFTRKHIDLALNHKNFEVRVLMARNYNIHFNEEQIRKGLNDKGFEYDAFDDSYESYSPDDVKEAFLKNPNITIPKDELRKILLSDDVDLTEMALERKDIEIDEDCVDHILKLNNRASIELLKNPNTHLNDKQILSFFYSSPDNPKILVQFYFSRDSVVISDSLRRSLGISQDIDINEVIRQKTIKP